jgi:hypothetical protein
MKFLLLQLQLQLLICLIPSLLLLLMLLSVGIGHYQHTRGSKSRRAREERKRPLGFGSAIVVDQTRWIQPRRSNVLLVLLVPLFAFLSLLLCFGIVDQRLGLVVRRVAGGGARRGVRGGVACDRVAVGGWVRCGGGVRVRQGIGRAARSGNEARALGQRFGWCMIRGRVHRSRE